MVERVSRRQYISGASYSAAHAKREPLSAHAIDLAASTNGQFA